MEDDYSVMLDDCEERESRLSDWERKFVASVQDQLASGRGLSDRQKETLDGIWEKVTENG